MYPNHIGMLWTLLRDIRDLEKQSEESLARLDEKWKEKNKQLNGEHHRAEVALVDQWQKRIKAQQQFYEDYQSQMARLQEQIEQLHGQLLEADKHYGQTLKEKGEGIREKAEMQQIRPEQYATVLQTLRQQFEPLAEKYQKLSLPGFIDYLHYVFSAQRKQDYEKLILIRITAQMIMEQIVQIAPEMSQREVDQLKAEYQNSLESLKQAHVQESQAAQREYEQSIQAEEQKMANCFDELLSGEDITQAIAFAQKAGQKGKEVQKAPITAEDTLVRVCLNVPVRQMFEGRTCPVIEEKLNRLMDQNGTAHFPTAVTAGFPAHWMIDNWEDPEQGVGIAHSFMYQMLSSVPVSQLTSLVIDPEKQGASVTPFFEAFQKIPDLLFQRRVITNRQEIGKSLADLNQELTGILQNRLASRFSDVYSAQQQQKDYNVRNYLVVIYNFPAGFDSASLSILRKILQMGTRCGVLAVIVNDGTVREGSSDQNAQISRLQEMCMQLVVSENGCTLYGIPFSVYAMPNQMEFSRFLSKYMLVLEGIRNQGIAFPPQIKRFMEETDEQQIRVQAAGLLKRLRGMGTSLCSSIAEQTPESIDLGMIRYPADLFSESKFARPILRQFGTRDGTGVVMPLSFELRRSINLLLKGEEREMLALTDHIVWSLISELPVNGLRLIVFDPVNMGDSAKGFRDVLASVPDLFYEKNICTREEELIQAVDELESNIADFKNGRMGGVFRSFLEYNQKTKHRKIPVRLLVLYDFPADCNRVIRRIQNIVKNGGPCGVYTVLCSSAQATMGRYDQSGESLKQIQGMCTTIVCKKGSYQLFPFSLWVKIPPLPDASVREQYLAQYKNKSEKDNEKGISLQETLPEKLFAGNSTHSLRIPIGLGDGDQITELVLGVGQSHYGLISGAPGSGKSVLLHTLIISAMLNYSPEELQLYLMDFKDGVEFQCYDKRHMPHIRLLALSAMQEFGQSILEELQKELNRRSEIFKSCGAVGLKEYRRNTGKKMPRVLVIMDEFQNLYESASNRKIADRCANLTVDLIARGRSFGINILMATQSTKRIGTLSLGKESVEMMRMRIGLKCNENDCFYLFGDSKTREALSLMPGPTGTAVMNRDYMEDPLQGFRSAFIPDDEKRKWLDLIETTFADQEAQTMVFEGEQEFPLLDYCRQIHLSTSRDAIPVIHLGMPIKVAPAYKIRLDRKIRHNLLICGSDDEIAANLVQVYTFFSLMNLNSTVYVVDGDRITDEPGGGPYYPVFERFGSRFHVVEREKDIIQMIHDTYEKFLEWKQENSSEHVFILIRSLQFVELIRKMLTGKVVREDEYLGKQENRVEKPLPEATREDPFARFFALTERRAEEQRATESRSTETNASVKLRTMISDGNAYGIHFVISVSDYQTVRETMTMGVENTLNKFPERIIFSLSDNDGARLMDGMALSKMPKAVKHLVLINQDGVKQEDGSTGPYQLKPFIMPTPDELMKALWKKE